MIIQKKHKIKSLIIALCTIIIALLVIFYSQIQYEKEKLFHNTSIFLEEAIKINIANKSRDSYYLSEYEFDPKKNKIGEYETRTVRYADTTFTFQRRIADPATNAFNSFQTLFLDIHQLHPNEIHLIYDSLLKDKNIHVDSSIGITASFYTKLNEWSNDTTTIDINLRTEFSNQGNYEDINYYAYMHYSLYTLWRIMPKTIIYLLFTCNLLIGLFLCWEIYKRHKAKKNGITLLKDGNYQIKDILLNTKEKVFVIEGNEIKLTNQIYELLLLFLSTENHRVSKTDIKQNFWPKTIDATSNMTSAVNRTNKILKEANSIYIINTDKDNEEFYVFSPLE